VLLLIASGLNRITATTGNALTASRQILVARLVLRFVGFITIGPIMRSGMDAIAKQDRRGSSRHNSWHECRNAGSMLHGEVGGQMVTEVGTSGAL